MARTKRFQKLIDRLPETGTSLIDWHKWLMQNGFIQTIGIDTDYITNDLIIGYMYKGDKKGYEYYSVSILIKSNTSVYYLKNKFRSTRAQTTKDKKNNAAPGWVGGIF